MEKSSIVCKTFYIAKQILPSQQNINVGSVGGFYKFLDFPHDKIIAVYSYTSHIKKQKIL